MNRIEIRELWHDQSTGNYHARVYLNGRNLGSAYSPEWADMVAQAAAGVHEPCEIWRKLRGRPAQRVLRGKGEGK